MMSDESKKRKKQHKPSNEVGRSKVATALVPGGSLGYDYRTGTVVASYTVL